MFLKSKNVKMFLKSKNVKMFLKSKNSVYIISFFKQLLFLLNELFYNKFKK